MTSDHLRRFVLLALPLATLVLIEGAGCGQGAAPEATARQRSGLSANADEVLGFENAADWHVISSPPVALTTSSTHSQGASSLGVAARGYVSIQSATISIGSALPGTISFDLLLPPPSNPDWYGAAQLYIDCHSHNLYNQYIGQQELTGQPIGQFSTETFSVPAAITGALTHGCADLSFTIAINVPTNATGTYLLDNLQLGGPPAVITCSSTLGSLGDTGLTGTTLTFSNQVTRPDLGTVTFESTTVVSDPVIVTRTVSLNGSPAYIIREQTASNGTSSTTIDAFPPITGVQHIVMTSDGNTVSLVVDGRKAVPQPVGGPYSFQFQDGQPPPTVTAPPGLQSAVSQLVSSAENQIPNCANGALGGLQAALPQPVGTDNGHASGDSGMACNSCEWECDAKELFCGFTAPRSEVCDIVSDIFGFLGDLVCTVVVDTIDCTKQLMSCQRGCHTAGTACCPVDCGGAGIVTTPIGLCCESGETCLKRGSSGGFFGSGAHVAICCSSGQTPCGGNQCCGTDTQCVPSVVNGPPSVCCSPSNINPSGICCLLGACRSDADCPESSCAPNGCCAIR